MNDRTRPAPMPSSPEPTRDPFQVGTMARLDARKLRAHVLPALVTWMCALTAPAQAAPDPLAGRVEQLAQGRGASKVRLAEKHGKLAKNGSETLALTLAPKQCVVAAASAEEAVSDLALSLEIKDGPALSDETSGPGASLRYCAGATDEKVNVRVRSEQSTRFSVGIWQVVTAADAGAPVQAAAEPAVSVPAAPTVSLNKRLQTSTAARAAGFDPMTPPREEDVSDKETRKREVVLAADQCYRVIAVSESSTTEIELSLNDPKGAALASSKGKLDALLPATAPFCPKSGGAHTIALRALAGSTRVAWQVVGATNPEIEARWPVGGKGNQLVATRMRDIHRNQGAKAPAMAFESGELGTAEVHASTFDVVGGRCYLAVAEGVPSLRALELELSDQRGNTVARSQEQNSINMLRVCAELSGRWTLRAKAFKGYGAFGVQVFVAPPQ
jgi:hypothetical protein